MNPRAPLALLVVTLLTLGTLYFLRQNISPTREAGENRRYAAVFEPEDITEIDIRRGDETISLRRESAGWRVVAPMEDRASPEAVDRLLMAARFMEVRDRQTGRIAENFPEAGLVPPRLRIELRGEERTAVDIGAGTALPQEVFAKVDGERSVLRVADTIVELAAAPAASFRDPRLTELVADDIEKFTVRRADGEMTLRRERGKWMIDKPVRAAADPQAVRAFLDPLLGLRIEAFGAAAEGAAAPLPVQEAAIGLTPRGGGEDLELRVTGSEAAEPDSLAAYFEKRGGDIVVDGSAWKLFSVSPEELRDRSLGYVDIDTIDRILVESDGASVTLRRDGTEWIGQPDGRKRSNAEVEKLVAAFNGARVGAFRTAERAEATGLTAPRQRIVFYAWLSENSAEDTAGAHAVAGVKLGEPSAEGEVFAQPEDGEETVTAPASLSDAARQIVLPAKQPVPQ